MSAQTQTNYAKSLESEAAYSATAGEVFAEFAKDPQAVGQFLLAAALKRVQNNALPSAERYLSVLFLRDAILEKNAVFLPLFFESEVAEQLVEQVSSLANLTGLQGCPPFLAGADWNKKYAILLMLIFTEAVEVEKIVSDKLNDFEEIFDSLQTLNIPFDLVVDEQDIFVQKFERKEEVEVASPKPQREPPKEEFSEDFEQVLVEEDPVDDTAQEVQRVLNQDDTAKEVAKVKQELASEDNNRVKSAQIGSGTQLPAKMPQIKAFEAGKQATAALAELLPGSSNLAAKLTAIETSLNKLKSDVALNKHFNSTLKLKVWDLVRQAKTDLLNVEHSRNALQPDELRQFESLLSKTSSIEAKLRVVESQNSWSSFRDWFVSAILGGSGVELSDNQLNQNIRSGGSRHLLPPTPNVHEVQKVIPKSAKKEMEVDKKQQAEVETRQGPVLKQLPPQVPLTKVTQVQEVVQQIQLSDEPPLKEQLLPESPLQEQPVVKPKLDLSEIQRQMSITIDQLRPKQPFAFRQFVDSLSVPRVSHTPSVNQRPSHQQSNTRLYFKAAPDKPPEIAVLMQEVDEMKRTISAQRTNEEALLATHQKESQEAQKRQFESLSEINRQFDAKLAQKTAQLSDKLSELEVLRAEVDRLKSAKESEAIGLKDANERLFAELSKKLSSLSEVVNELNNENVSLPASPQK